MPVNNLVLLTQGAHDKGFLGQGDNVAEHLRHLRGILQPRPTGFLYRELFYAEIQTVFHLSFSEKILKNHRFSLPD